MNFLVNFARSKIAKNCQKLPRIAKNWQKLPKTSKFCHRFWYDFLKKTFWQ